MNVLTAMEWYGIRLGGTVARNGRVVLRGEVYLKSLREENRLRMRRVRRSRGEHAG